MKRKKKSKFNWDRVTINLTLIMLVIILCLQLTIYYGTNNLKEDYKQLNLQENALVELTFKIDRMHDIRLDEHTEQIEELYGMCGEN